MLNRARLLLAIAALVLAPNAAYAWHAVTFSLFDNPPTGWYGKYGFALAPFGSFNSLWDDTTTDHPREVVAFIEEDVGGQRQWLLIINGFTADPGQSYFHDFNITCIFDERRQYLSADATYFYAAGHAFWRWNIPPGPACMNIRWADRYSFQLWD
jgi:hypothetical protein